MKKVQFEIPASILKYYTGLTKDFKGILDWRAKPILGNSSGKSRKSTKFLNIGYVGIGLDNNIIVPISLDDEHHTGLELIEHLIDKKKIPDGKYMTIHAGGRSNSLVSRTFCYASTVEEYADYIKLYTKYLEYGGNPDLMVYNPGYSGDEKYTTTVSRFLQGITDGKFVIPSGISYLGEKFFNILKSFILLYKETYPIRDSVKHTEVHQFNRNLERLQSLAIEMIDSHCPIWQAWGHKHKLMDVGGKIRDVLRVAGLTQLETLFLGANGFKNLLHIELKKHAKKNLKWKAPGYNEWSNYKEFFVDLKASVEKMNELSGINY